MATTRNTDDHDASFDVRRYEASDAERVWEIHERTIRDSPVEFAANPTFDSDLRNVNEHYFETGGEFLVGRLGGRVIATGGMKPVDEESVELQRLRVLPDHQRNGYGTVLLDRLERFATGRFERIELHADDVLSVARRIYEKRGYEETHREPRPMIDGEVVFYEKEI